MGTVSPGDLGEAFLATSVTISRSSPTVTLSRPTTPAERAWMIANGAGILGETPELWNYLTGSGVTQATGVAITTAMSGQNVVVNAGASNVAATLPVGASGLTFNVYASGGPSVMLFPNSGGNFRGMTAGVALSIPPGSGLTVWWDATLGYWQYGDAP